MVCYLCAVCLNINNILLLYSPAGWDNDKKIAILYENMHTMSPDDYYTDVVVKPPVVRKVSCSTTKCTVYGISCRYTNMSPN